MATRTLEVSGEELDFPDNWEMISVKEEPEDGLTEGDNVSVEELLSEDQIKEEDAEEMEAVAALAAAAAMTEPEPSKSTKSATPKSATTTKSGSQQCLGELHYMQKQADIKPPPALTDPLLGFTPFAIKDEEEEDTTPDLSYLDDDRLCMSPQDHEIDPDAPNKGHGKKIICTNKNGKGTKVITILGDLRAVPQRMRVAQKQKKVNQTMISDMLNCVVELCKRPGCGIDCKCFGRTSEVKSAAPRGGNSNKRQMDGRRQMKMSEKLRAFYEERHRNRLAKMRKVDPESEVRNYYMVTSGKHRPFQPQQLPTPSTSKPPILGLPKKNRTTKSRRLDESISCPICNKEFHYAYSLRRHVKAHTMEVETPPMLERVDVPSKVVHRQRVMGVMHMIPQRVVNIAPIDAGSEDPPNLEAENAPYTHIKALLKTTSPPPPPQPSVQKPAGKIVLNVPKVGLIRRQRVLASSLLEQTQFMGKTVINIAPIPELGNNEVVVDGSDQEESEVMSPEQTEQANVAGNIIHPSCNPVVVIAPIEDAGTQPEMPKPRGSKTSNQVYNMYQAQRIIEVSPIPEPGTSGTQEDENDPLNDSGVTEADVDELNNFKIKKQVSDAVATAKRVFKRKGSAISLGLSTASRMKNSKIRNKKKTVRRQQLSKNMKAVVGPKMVIKVSDSPEKETPEGDWTGRRPKRKASFMALKLLKNLEEEEEEVGGQEEEEGGQEEEGGGERKRQRSDSDSGIETESDGSDRAKKSPMAKPLVTLSLASLHADKSSNSVTLLLVNGTPISPDELHSRVDHQIVKRTPTEPIICPVCDKKFSYPSEIKRHIMMHTNEREFQCSECDKAFARRPHLNEHMRVHTGERPFKCKSCPAAFAQKSNLIIHNRTHTGARPFACNECGKRFRRQDAQTQHQLTHHSNAKPYSCAECGAAFPCLRYLKDHMKCHSKERPFKCGQCNAAFVCNKYLKLHIRALHTNVRPYKCDMCPAKFTQSGKLVEHQRIHTGERPYTCSSCGAAFVRSGHLRRHLLTHTGERPYHCDTCPAKFSQKDHLKRHVKSMHPDTAASTTEAANSTDNSANCTEAVTSTDEADTVICIDPVTDTTSEAVDEEIQE